MSIAYHCDNDDCNAWTRNPKGHMWYFLKTETFMRHFCTNNCLLRDVSREDPAEVINNVVY